MSTRREIGGRKLVTKNEVSEERKEGSGEKCFSLGNPESHSAREKRRKLTIPGKCMNGNL